MLAQYCEEFHKDAKADLATCFIDRSLRFCKPGGSVGLVTPQNWLFLGMYQKIERGVAERARVLAHKTKRFPAADNPVVAENEAFVLSGPETRSKLQKAYAASAALYFRGQPAFEDVLAEIARWAPKL